MAYPTGRGSSPPPFTGPFAAVLVGPFDEGSAVVPKKIKNKKGNYLYFQP